MSSIDVSGIIDAAGEVVNILLPGGTSTVALQVTGTWVGQIEFEGTIDNTNYTSVEASNGTQTVNATAGNDIFILPGAAYAQIRARASAWTSGTAYITFMASSGVATSILTGAIPAGSNAIGTIALTAGEAHVGEVSGNTDVIDVTLSLNTNIYASGDVLAATQEVASAMRVAAGKALLHSIVLNDKDDQGVELDLVFLQTNVSIGTENSAASVSDADADKILGLVNVASSDWEDLGGCRIATKTSVGLVLEAGAGSTSIYIAAITRGTPTHTASGITLKLGLLRD